MGSRTFGGGAERASTRHPGDEFLDIGITGFDPGEIDTIVSDFEDHHGDPTDDISQATTEVAVAQSGDVFLLGVHRLLVGDARDEDSYARLMQGEMAGMGFHDPPYNVRVAGHVGGRGASNIGNLPARPAR